MFKVHTIMALLLNLNNTAIQRLVLVLRALFEQGRTLTQSWTCKLTEKGWQ